MANIPIWPGSSSFFAGDTPFGFYDNDSEFQVDADKVANFCARRLGYPLVDVELQSGSFYTAFEEAVTTYGNELYAYKIRDNQLSLEGLSTGSDLNNSVITPSFEPIVRLTEQYGAEAGSGGNIEYLTGSIPVTASKQNYDLTDYTVASQIRKHAGSSTATDFAIDISSPRTLGRISVKLTNSQTNSLKPGRYLYDIVLTRSGTKTKVVEGMVLVRQGVTR